MLHSWRILAHNMQKRGSFFNLSVSETNCIELIAKLISLKKNREHQVENFKQNKFYLNEKWWSFCRKILNNSRMREFPKNQNCDIYTCSPDFNKENVAYFICFMQISSVVRLRVRVKLRFFSSQNICISTSKSKLIVFNLVWYTIQHLFFLELV